MIGFSFSPALLFKWNNYFCTRMKRKIFFLIAIAGLLGVLAAYGKTAPLALTGGADEVHADGDVAQWDGVFLSHPGSSLKKCFTSLFWENPSAFLLLRPAFHLYSESFFQSPLIKTAFDHILIHAP